MEEKQILKVVLGVVGALGLVYAYKSFKKGKDAKLEVARLAASDKQESDAMVTAVAKKKEDEKNRTSLSGGIFDKMRAEYEAAKKKGKTTATSEGGTGIFNVGTPTGGRNGSGIANSAGAQEETSSANGWDSSFV